MEASVRAGSTTTRKSTDLEGRTAPGPERINVADLRKLVGQLNPRDDLRRPRRIEDDPDTQIDQAAGEKLRQAAVLVVGRWILGVLRRRMVTA